MQRSIVSWSRIDFRIHIPCLFSFSLSLSFPSPPLVIARGFHGVETPSRPRDRLNAKKRWQRGCSRIFPREHHRRLPLNLQCKRWRPRCHCRLVGISDAWWMPTCTSNYTRGRFSTIYHGSLSNDFLVPRAFSKTFAAITSIFSKFSLISFWNIGIFVSRGAIFLWNFVELN